MNVIFPEGDKHEINRINLSELEGNIYRLSLNRLQIEMEKEELKKLIYTIVDVVSN